MFDDFNETDFERNAVRDYYVRIEAEILKLFSLLQPNQPQEVILSAISDLV